MDELEYNGQPVAGNFDRAVSWMHTYTAEADPREDVCLNCHGDESSGISWNNKEWTEHTMEGRTSRQAMDAAEAAEGINMDNPLDTLCESCHSDKRDEVQCDNEWRRHLTEGRVSEHVWVDVSNQLNGNTCGW